MIKLNHMDNCPKCDGKVMLNVKINNGFIPDVTDDDPPGTKRYICDKDSVHCFIQKPGSKLEEVLDNVISMDMEKPVRKSQKSKTSKKETKKSATSKASKKEKAVKTKKTPKTKKK